MTVCFEGTPPRELHPGEDFGRPYLRRAFLVSGGVKRALSTSGGSISLAGAAPGDCALYEVDLEAAARGLDPRITARHEGALATDPDLWLYRPGPLPEGATATLVFELPPGHAVSAPWPLAGEGDPLRFRLPASTFLRRGRVVLGRFERLLVAVPGGVLDVALLGDIDAGESGVERWLSEAGRAVSTLYGTFPRERVQVTVTPVWGAGVPFGLVLRAGGPGVHLLAGERSEEEDLVGEWVAVHELSHLALPFVRHGDPWLSEGIATYYQHVLRARAGFFDEREAWQKLHDGFERGRGDLRGSTLAAAAEAMHANRAYLRVYWTGTALALLADVELRRRSEGARSLDEALRRFGECCLEPDATFTAEELCQRLDALVEDDVLSALARAQLGSTAFPDLEATYRDLGVRVKGGRVSLDDDAPFAYIRRAIMSPWRAP